MRDKEGVPDTINADGVIAHRDADELVDLISADRIRPNRDLETLKLDLLAKTQDGSDGRAVDEDKCACSTKVETCQVVAHKKVMS